VLSVGSLVREEGGEVCLQSRTRLNGKARGKRIERCVGQYMGRIEVQFASPDQSRLLVLLHNRLEKAMKDLQAVAGTDAR
jgi:hypothetical protein